MKRVFSAVITFALAITSLVALESPASAADNVGVYPLNINNASAPGNAKDFTTYNGKVYFTADSVDHGRAIFSTDATNPAGFQYVDSRGVAPKMGNPKSLFGFNNNIFYWDSETNGSTLSLFGRSTTSNGHFRVETPFGGDLVTDSEHPYNFVSYNDKLFILGADSNTPTDLKLWVINTAGDLSVASDFAFVPQISGTASAVGYGTSNPAMNILDGKLYVNTSDSGWNTRDSKIMQYDIAGDNWTEITDNGTTFAGSQVFGNYRYNNQDVLIYQNYVNNAWQYYYLTPDAVIHRLGTIASTYGGSFVNLGERLFFYSHPSLSEVSTTDGALTDLTSTFAPTAQSVAIESIVETNGNLVMMAMIYDSSAIPANVQHLYKWSGTGAISQLGTISPIAGGNWLPEWPSTTGWGRNTAMIKAGNGVIVNLYQATELGYEPYYVSLTGTATVLGNIDSASDGSSPDFYCSNATGNNDYIVATVTGTFGEKSVVTEFKQDGIYLKYKVLDLPNLRNVCGVASDGTYTYFKAYSNATGQDGLYKMDANHAVTRIGDINGYPRDANVFNGQYFWYDDDSSNLFVTNAAGVQTKLTGNGPDGINDGSIREVKAIGSKLYFMARDDATSNYNLYGLDMANPTAPFVAYLTDASSDWITRPSNLTVSGTKLYFTRIPKDGTEGAKVYAIDSANNSPAVQLFDINPDNSITDLVNYMKISGTDFFINDYDNNNRNNYFMIKRSGTATSGTVLSLPNSFKVECMALVGGELMVSDRNGVSKYLGDGSSTFRDTGITFNNDTYALCDSFTSTRGTYISYDEVAMQGGPWGTEPAYIGTLIPWATERLGVTVTENPATALNGTIQPGVPGPTTSVDTDDINLGTLDETKDFAGSYGSIVFPDGSGFTIDSKGNVKAKTKSIYLVQASGKIKFSYVSGGKTKSVTCTIKNFGSTKKVKRAFTTQKVYTSGTACKLSPTVVKAMKTGVVTIVQTLKVKRYYSTTMKAKTPVGGIIKVQNRKMTVRMGLLG